MGTKHSMDGLRQVFDANSRTLLRRLKGHKRPVHVARFALDRLHVLSGSDDATVRCAKGVHAHAGCGPSAWAGQDTTQSTMPHRSALGITEIPCIMSCFVAGDTCHILWSYGIASRFAAAYKNKTLMQVASSAVRLQVRLWDVSAGEQVTRLTGHTDYVRAAAASPSSSDSWATGAPS